jgi:hypothetical protein
MGTSKEDIRAWLERGKGVASHLIVVCDTFSYEDYPSWVYPDQSVLEQITKYQNAGMQRVMEVYSYELPLEEQLNENRAWHTE